MERCKCIVCGEIFQSIDEDIKYCSDACEKIFHKSKYLKRTPNTYFVSYSVKCKNCNKEFTSGVKKAKFCSETCSEEFDNNLKINLTKKCKYCLTEFNTFSKNKLYCSTECYDKYFKKTYITTYKKKTQFNKTCSYCGKIFFTGNNRRIFCSEECREKYFPDRIPNNKWLKLRFEVLKRDNFTCQYCGRNVIDDKIKLHCDHIIPVSKNGTDELDNLITSCMECNLGKSDTLLEKQQEFYLKSFTRKDR